MNAMVGRSPFLNPSRLSIIPAVDVGVDVGVRVSVMDLGLWMTYCRCTCGMTHVSAWIEKLESTVEPCFR